MSNSDRHVFDCEQITDSLTEVNLGYPRYSAAQSLQQLISFPLPTLVQIKLLQIQADDRKLKANLSQSVHWTTVRPASSLRGTELFYIYAECVHSQ